MKNVSSDQFEKQITFIEKEVIEKDSEIKALTKVIETNKQRSEKVEKSMNSKEEDIKELIKKVKNLKKMETVKKEMKKLKEETKKCSLTLAAHIDDNVLGGDQAQEEVNNLFDHSKENDKEEDKWS